MRSAIGTACLAAACACLLLSQSGCQTTDAPDNNTAAPHLPFAMPSKAKLGDSKKKVFAHFFYPFPVSIDNKPPDNDYYAKGYLAPEGENNKHIKYGGYLRQRPLPRAPITGERWDLQDMMREVQLASDAGLDGFCIDILGTKDGRCPKLDMLLEATQKVAPTFKIMLMPDMHAEFKTKPENFISVLEGVRDNPAIFRTDDGRIVVSPWCPAKGTAGWWKDLKDSMASKGVRIYLAPVFQAWWN